MYPASSGRTYTPILADLNISPGRPLPEGSQIPVASKARPGLLTRRLDVVAGVYFVLACAALFRFTADDAFIVQRYASQFVRGHGLVFNIGERVSALTSPLHALLFYVPQHGVASPMLAYKIVGAIVVTPGDSLRRP